MDYAGSFLFRNNAINKQVLNNASMSITTTTALFASNPLHFMMIIKPPMLRSIRIKNVSTAGANKKVNQWRRSNNIPVIKMAGRQTERSST